MVYSPPIIRSSNLATTKAKAILPTKSLVKLSDIVSYNNQRKKVIKPKLKHSDNKVKKLKARQISIDPNFVADDNKTFVASTNSIQQVIDECHPDIKTFFNRASVKQYVARPGNLLMKLDTGITINITCLRYNRKRYKIIDPHGTELLDINEDN